MKWDEKENGRFVGSEDFRKEKGCERREKGIKLC